MKRVGERRRERRMEGGEGRERVEGGEGKGKGRGELGMTNFKPGL